MTIGTCYALVRHQPGVKTTQYTYQMQRVTLKGDIPNQVILPVLKNSCLKAHCKNKATCQTGFTDKGYHCLCTVGFKGEYCEIGKYLICGTACLTAVNNGDSNATGRQEEKDSKTRV